MLTKRLFFSIIMLFAVLGLSAQYGDGSTIRPSRKPSTSTTKKKSSTPSVNRKASPETQKKSTTTQKQQIAHRARMTRRAKASLCPDGNHPHMIDLGLPSGTKWACCNVDASKPEDYGGYYAWGEMGTKFAYVESTYKYKQNGIFMSLGSDIAGTSYDVGHVWGGSWMMPSKAQQDELRDNCTYEWTTVNGVKGGKFTSKKNGASIFLPAAGYRYDSELRLAGSNGYYWSSTQYPSNVYFAYYLDFYSGYTVWSYGNRYNGRSVRPVIRN